MQTSAQVTVRYTPETLLGRPIVGCVNLGEKNIAGFIMRKQRNKAKIPNRISVHVRPSDILLLLDL